MTKKDYLNNRYVSSELNGYWCVDFTPIGQLKIFIALDLSTRAVVGHFTKLKSDLLEEGKVVEQIIYLLAECEIQGCEPIILHSDNESIFNANTLCEYITSKNIKHSYADNKYKKHCNQALESFNRTLKRIVRQLLIEKLPIEKSKEKKALNFLPKLSTEAQFDLITEAITIYNNNPHKHLDGSTPHETQMALVLEEESALDKIVSPDQIFDVENDAVLEDFIEQSLARNHTKRAEELRATKKVAMENYNAYWFNLLLKFCICTKENQETLLGKQDQMLSELTSSKNQIIENLNHKLLDQTTELKSLQDLIGEQTTKLDDQRDRIDVLVAEADARKKLQEEVDRKKAKRKRRKPKDLRDGATFPEFEAAQEAITSSPDLQYRSEYARSRDRVANLILYLTGMRIGNLLHISSSNLGAMLHEDELRVKEIKSSDDKVLVWPMSPIAKQKVKEFEQDILVLQAGKEAGNPAFSSEENLTKPISRTWITKRVNAILKIAGKKLNKKISSHSYRIGVITMITRVAGVDVAREQIGHANIQTTYGYTRNTRTTKELNDLHDLVELEKQKRIPRHKSKSVKKIEEPEDVQEDLVQIEDL